MLERECASEAPHIGGLVVLKARDSWFLQWRLEEAKGLGEVGLGVAAGPGFVVSQQLLPAEDSLCSHRPHLNFCVK